VLQAQVHKVLQEPKELRVLKEHKELVDHKVYKELLVQGLHKRKERKVHKEL
jgi:hypothetical protein